jgi:hypothetical protein
VGTGCCTEHQDQHGEDRAGRDRVAEQRERVVTARKLLRHDAGADHGRQQECSSEPLRKDTLRKRGHQPGSVAFAVASGCRWSFQ